RLTPIPRRISIADTHHQQWSAPLHQLSTSRVPCALSYKCMILEFTNGYIYAPIFKFFRLLLPGNQQQQAAVGRATSRANLAAQWAELPPSERSFRPPSTPVVLPCSTSSSSSCTAIKV
ncbi:unnamed protein product, partial [Laminaria digitata]